MSRLILSACCLLLLTLTAARAEDAKPLAVFLMGPDRYPCVVLSIAGKEYSCLLNTGCTNSGLGGHMRLALGEPKRTARGHSYYELPEASIGSLRLAAGTRFYCIDWLENQNRSMGTAFDGVIGMDVLSGLSVSLDFDHGVVLLWPTDFEPSASAGQIPIELDRVPFTAAQVCGRELRFLVASGCEYELQLSRPLVDDLSKRDLAEVQHFDVGTMNGRASATRLGYVSEATYGSLRRESIQVVDFDKVGEPSETIGVKFLARFNPTFCFAKKEVFLADSKWSRARWWPILRGMTIADLDERAIVFAVPTDSPAFRAGIRPDDELENPPEQWMWQTPAPLSLSIRKANEVQFRPVQLVRARTGQTAKGPSEPAR